MTDVPRGNEVERKLRELDPYRTQAVDWIGDWLGGDWTGLIAVARGRHAEGHYRYGDSVMYEYNQQTLIAEAAQEIADAINYIALMLSRE